MKYRPILKGITNGSNFIIIGFLECLTRKYHNVSRIDSSGTDKDAFTTKHALADILPYLLIFPSLNKNIDFPQTESREIACRASGAATSAFYTKSEARFSVINVFSNSSVVRIIIDLPAL